MTMASRGTSTTTAERSARLWLRAYPRRWRFSYGEDLVGTLLDLAGPGARTVRLRDGLSVWRAGWSLRFREHPPLLPWLGYRIFGAGLPVEHRVWMIDDLLGRLYSARWVAGYLVVLTLVAGALSLLAGDPVLLAGSAGAWAAWSVLVAVSPLVVPRRRARTTWRRHVSGWVPPELRPRGERGEAVRELAEFRVSTGYEGCPDPLGGP